MSEPVILIADPNGPRRNAIVQIQSGAGAFRVLASATLGDTYRMVEAHMPQHLLVAAELAELPDFDALADMICLIGAALFIYGEERRPLSAKVAALAQRISGAESVAPAARARPDASLTPPDKAGPSKAPTGGVAAVSVAADRGATVRVATVRASAMPIPALAGRGPVDSIICIGASTGGIPALETVLATFPPDCPPTLIIQHIRPGFAEGLIRRLNGAFAPQVVAATDNQPLERGTICLAASTEHHLGLVPSGLPRLRLIAGAPVSGHRPSVDVLFAQVAALADRFSVRAALLTGMGADGAEGMCALRAAGALTIAQDRESSVVWGMPRVAVERGGATEVLPLTRIGSALLRADPCGKRQRAWG
ncbi:MAG: CheB methylesterase domain-containing protein [Paracoccus sp. (in: a-proteobacteria)]|uniref:CheB methylesterase domain-containing protein n=1 Tax=Paracoccus sp. TaxID=267 RepID=UPI00391CB2B6